jgi:TetR/AcrR family transcriptional regulator, cholesterol catabolism regulator
LTATTVAGRPLSATQAATRRRLLDAARELASEGGYEAVSMRAVAERAGVSPPTAYQYFASRDHVLVEVLSDLAAGTTALVTERPSRRRDPVERTVATLRRVVQRMEDEPTLFVALLRAYLSGAPEVRASREGMQSSMREWVDSALGPTEVPDREAVVSILEAVLLTGLVSLVMGANSPADIGDDLERAARLLLSPRATP